MPLTRRQFDLGITEDTEQRMERVHRLLSERKDEAFTKEEVLAELGENATLKRVEEALEKLSDLRAVEKRYFRGKPYYAFRENLDRLW